MRSLIDLGVSEQDRQSLLMGIHEGKYNLLLGAGSSYGCVGGDGEHLKDGITLSLEINKKFNLNLNEDESKKLPMTYEEAMSAEPAKLQLWLKSRFTKCTPTWQSKIFDFYWKRIWTFNIDDVLENAFDENEKENKFISISSFDWKEKIVPVEATDNAIQVVHLHGRAQDLGTRNDGLVFSIDEYSQATKNLQQWHASFQTHYLETPFIVCGASLSEEVDISECIRSNNYARAKGTPSFIVSFNLDEAQKKRMNRFNLVPIVCPLDVFFEILHNELVEYKKKADVSIARLKPGTYERFSSQFRRLNISDTIRLARQETDFYGGDEPIWNDILENKDASFHVVETAASLINGRDNRYAVLLHGTNVTGKSTALLRLAYKAIQKSFKAYIFRHEEGLNADVIIDYLSQDERVVLFIDDAADHLEAIGKILKISKDKNKSARIFLTFRSSRLRGFRLDVPDEFKREFYIGKMKNSDVKNFVSKRKSSSRLGKHIRKKEKDIVYDLNKICKSDLLDSISYIEFSEPIKQRVRKLVLKQLTNADMTDLFATIICVHRFGFSLPLRVAMVTSNMQFKALADILDKQYHSDGLIVRDDRGLRMRHRIISEYAWKENFDERERYRAMSSIVSVLAPLVNPSVIRYKGIEHLIIREILDQAQVSSSIGSMALKFYEDHESYLGWSSRYWDQRALMESNIEGHFTKAYSYSQKAISLERHPFAYTSLGVICMRQCLRIVEKNKIDAMSFFREGEEALTQAWELGLKSGNIHEHPFIKFFTSALNLLRKIHIEDIEYEVTLDFINIWLSRAKDSPAFSTVYGQKRLRDIESKEIKARLKLKTIRAS